MGAHKKYRDMMEQLKSVGVDVVIIKEGDKEYKVVAGNKHITYGYRVSANRYLNRIHQQETNKLLIFNYAK